MFAGHGLPMKAMWLWYMLTISTYIFMSVQLLREQFDFIADISITLGKHELLL